jgi:hypothetical protein
MGRRIESVTSAEFDELFTRFEHTAYRLETLQQYDVSYEEESYAVFLAGHPAPTDAAKNEWTNMIAAAASSGKSFRRVHIINEPLSDYLRYEIGWSYGPNVQAGEDVRILVGQPGPLGLPGRDYWLFDSRDLWVMEYDDEGRFIYAERIDDPAVIVEHCYWRDKALHLSTPYGDYINHSAALRHATLKDQLGDTRVSA